jgi:hypothetical protein
VWLVHGLYNKLLGGSARHLAIVQSVPGLGGATGARLTAVGAGEIAIVLWVLGMAALGCRARDGRALSMNVLELIRARPPALAGRAHSAEPRVPGARGLRRALPPWYVRLRRHPFPIQAHFRECVTLTYALPPEVLRPLLTPGLELDRGYGFVAARLVDRGAEARGMPAALGQDSFAGYRVHDVQAPAGRRFGAAHLRSDGTAPHGDRRNLLTHYNYHRCPRRRAAPDPLPTWRPRIGGDG